METYMSWIDWLILCLPICLVMYMGFFCRRYIRGVTDYLSCGRLCGRYVLGLGEVANALSIIGLLSIIEIKYKTGFALAFWNHILSPLGIVLSLMGFCYYRFRETRAMSLGQFLEIRYGSRRLRVFAAFLRSLAEMLANMIMPALAARFFIQMLNLPQQIFGLPTFDVLVVLFLVLAITLICLGGTLSLVITDTIQGMILYPLLVCFIIFIICKFSFTEQIMPTMADRVPGESFLNPFDISKLRDFNVFSMVIVAVFNSLMHRASWLGAGSDTAARSAHEQKMACLLGTWRGSIVSIFYMLIAVALITFMHHKDFADGASKARKTLVSRVAEEIITEEDTRTHVIDTITALPPDVQEIGVSTPPSQANNPDTRFLENVHQVLTTDARAKAQTALDQERLSSSQSDAEFKEHSRKTIIEAEGKANDLFQQCRTLYNQLTLSVIMRQLLPTGLFGAFCLLLFLAMLSTDDTRIYSATLTISQDCVLPFFKNGLSPENHIKMIRIVAIGVGVFFAFGSHFMAQLDYINLFVTLVCAMWLNGCGPVMTLGLYWKKGTRQGAWASLLSGMFMSIIYIIIQRNWADVFYPMLAKAELVNFTDRLLRLLSAPFDDWVKWEMNAIKCPVNSYEFTFFSSLLALLIYIVVSLLTCKENYNLERMLHRGKYQDPNEPPKNLKVDWSLRNIFKNLIGITPEYTKGDRLIAYGIFGHSFVYGFVVMFLCVLGWNAISPWSIEYWKWYFFVVFFGVPGLVTFISTFWFSIGGTIDLFRLFRDLQARTHVNALDDGRVEGNVSLADLQREKAESQEKKD